MTKIFDLLDKIFSFLVDSKDYIKTQQNLWKTKSFGGKNLNRHENLNGQEILDRDKLLAISDMIEVIMEGNSPVQKLKNLIERSIDGGKIGAFLGVSPGWKAGGSKLGSRERKMVNGGRPGVDEVVQTTSGMSSEGLRRAAGESVDREGLARGGSGRKEQGIPLSPNANNFKDILVQIYPGSPQKVQNNSVGRRNLESLLQVSSVEKSIVFEGQSGSNHDKRGNFDNGFLKDTDMTKMSQAFPSNFFSFVKKQRQEANVSNERCRQPYANEIPQET